MKVIIKIISYYIISICLGNLFCFLSGLITQHEAMVGYTNQETFWIIPVASTIISLPLFIPIILYFLLLRFFNPPLPNRIFLSFTFGIVLGVAYIFVVDQIIGWISEVEIWLPFVAGAGFAGVLTEIFFNKRPQQNEAFDSYILENP